MVLSLCRCGCHWLLLHAEEVILVGSHLFAHFPLLESLLRARTFPALNSIVHDHLQWLLKHPLIVFGHFVDLLVHFSGIQSILGIICAEYISYFHAVVLSSQQTFAVQIDCCLHRLIRRWSQCSWLSCFWWYKFCTFQLMACFCILCLCHETLTNLLRSWSLQAHFIYHPNTRLVRRSIWTFQVGLPLLSAHVVKRLYLKTFRELVMFHLLFYILNLLLMYLFAQLWYFWSESLLCAADLLLLYPLLFKFLLLLTHPLLIPLLKVFNHLPSLQGWFRPHPLLLLAAILDFESHVISLGHLRPKSAFIFSVFLDLLLQLFHVLLSLLVPFVTSLLHWGHWLLLIVVEWLWDILEGWLCPGLLVWWKVMRSWNFGDVDLFWEAWVAILEADDWWFEFALFHFVYSPLEIEVLTHHLLFFLFLIHPLLVPVINVQAMSWIWFHTIRKVLRIFLPMFSIQVVGHGSALRIKPLMIWSSCYSCTSTTAGAAGEQWLLDASFRSFW